MKYCSLCGRTSNETRIVTSKGIHYCGKCYQRIRNASKVYELPPKGEIRYNEEGKPICHICGKAYSKLMSHVRQIHDMSAYEYKKEFGLDLHKSVMSKESIEIASRRNKENWHKIKDNLLVKGYKTRFKAGSKGRTRDKVSLQTLKRLKGHFENIKKGSER